jgi:hypothetical protein
MALFGMVFERQGRAGPGGERAFQCGASPIGLQPWRVHATKSRERQLKGIAAAKARRVYTGRKPQIDPAAIQLLRDKQLVVQLLPNSLMRHQHGQGHVPQQLTRDAAEYEFPQARMAVATDNQ